MIMLFHFTCRYYELYPAEGGTAFSFSAGGAAVSVFFMLSAYLACAGKFTGAGQYIKKKFIRLFPAYWVCVLITWPLTRAFLPERAVSVKDFLLNFTMLHFFAGAESVDGAYWYLKNELIFYFLIFLCVLIFKSRRALPFAALLWAAALLGSHFLKDYLPVPPQADVLLIKNYAHSFIGGIGIYFLIEREEKKKALYLFLAAADTALSCVLAFLFCESRVNLYFFLASLVLILSAAFIFKKRGNPSEKVKKLLMPLVFISSISYPLYLIHQNNGYIILNALRSLGAQSEWIAAAPAAAAILAAYLIHTFIEVPAAKRFLKGNGD